MWFTKKRKTKNYNPGMEEEGQATQLLCNASLDSHRHKEAADPIELVKGRFNAVEAADILISLINHKIRHHNLKSLNNNLERKSRENSQKRLSELRESKRRIKEMVVFGNKSNMWIEIECQIHIRLVEKPDDQI